MDIILSIMLAWISVYSLINIDATTYLSADFVQRSDLLMEFFPELQSKIDIILTIRFFGEFITLLMNKRKRALHDFIAGTIVVNKEFAV